MNYCNQTAEMRFFAYIEKKTNIFYNANLNILGGLPLEEKVLKNHNVIVENRGKFTLTGVKEVLSFDENTILLDTALGKLTLRGENLKLGQFDTGKGDISGTGEIYALVYSSNDNSGGFFSRLFK